MNTRPSYSHALRSFSPSSRSATVSMFAGTLGTSYVHDVIACGVFLLDAGGCRRRIFATRGSTVVRWSSWRQRSLFHPRWAIAVRDDMTYRWRPLSVDPRDRHPLWCCVDALNRGLQLGDRLVEIVVHDSQIEEMPVCLLQHVRLLRQTLQTTIKLKAQATLLQINVCPIKKSVVFSEQNFTV